MDRQTITDENREPDTDDTCGAAMDARTGAERCLAAADALPDGAPEQVSVLLRGLLAAQLGTLQVMISIADHLDAWHETDQEDGPIGPSTRPTRSP